MKFVALVSGGKDSCFNILHCLANGHELVALANLKPADSKVQELDSFMFQTVGHDVLEFYSEAIGVPMYRGDIKGTSKNQQLNYIKTEEDEIEDLYNLLNKVITEQPDIKAVSVGAILSSYQRTRVEDVCARLGLTSLAYLWQRDQLELMTEMVQSSMDARLIKVAAIGLNESHLGKSLKEMYNILLRLNQRFDVHICGEGGEFESLVLDAPFFIKKLELVNFETFVSKDQVAYINPIVKIAEKNKEIDGEYHNVKELNIDWKKFIPGFKTESYLNEKFQEIYDNLNAAQSSSSPSILNESITSYEFNEKPSLKINKLKNKLFISNITSDKESVEDQTLDVFDQLNTILSNNNLEPKNIQHSTLLLSSMSNFVKINSIYIKNFNEPLPPSRVCVQTILPSSNHLQLSVVVLLDSSKKTGLHVQGRSYWAPANIGPYSQSIIDENLIASLSGQIPLIPGSMELPLDDNQLHNSILSLQHFDNVKKVIGCELQLSTVAFIKDSKYFLNISNTWKEYSELDDQINPLNVLLIVQVEELPKSADAEWGGLSFKKLQSLYEDEDEDEVTDLSSKLDKSLSINDSLYEANNGDFVSTLSLTDEEFKAFKFNNTYHYTVYTRPESILKIADDISIDFIPVKNIWNFSGDLKDYGIVIRA